MGSSEVRSSHVTIIKLGGSIVTHKDKAFSLNSSNISRLASELSNYVKIKGPDEKIVVIHGGGSFAHMAASTYVGYKSSIPVEELGSVIIGSAARELNSRVLRILLDYGLRVFPMQPSAFVYNRNGQPSMDSVSPLSEMVASDWIPLLYGDIMFDVTERKWTILSGEGIIHLLCQKLPVRRILAGTDTNGVLRDLADPASKIDLISSSNMSEISRYLKSSRNIDVTGGMLSKVQGLLSEAQEYGITEVIFNGNEDGSLLKVLKGDYSIGTTIRK